MTQLSPVFKWKRLLFLFKVATLLMIAPLFSKGQTYETIPSGSWIIKTGSTVNTGLKPYGLIYKLLKDLSVPVKWIINPTKAKDSVDFTRDNNAASYSGSAFIIAKPFRTTAVDNIVNIWIGNGVLVDSNKAPLSLPVFKTIYAAPRWTLDKVNGKIITQFFSDAGIPPSAHGGSSINNWKVPDSLGACDDIFVLPHADPTWAIHKNLLTWNTTFKGSIWTGCHAVSVLENTYNPANTSQQMNFLTQKVTIAGPNIILPVNGSVNPAQNSLVLWDAPHPDPTRTNADPFLTNAGTVTSGQIASPSDPVSQFLGIPDGAIMAKGSEKIYVPVKGGGWLPSTKIITWDATPPVGNVPTLGINPTVAIAYGRGFGNSNNGWVMYSAGHDNNLGPVSEAVAIRRAFFNFSLLAIADKVQEPTLSGITMGQVLSPGVPIPLSVSVPPQATLTGYTFQWSSSCGGTFSPSSTASSVTFTPTAVSGTFSCNISIKITDPCGRESFDTKSVNIVCAVNATTTIQQPCNGGSNGIINMTVAGGPSPYTYSWTRTEGGSGSGSGTTISGLNAGTYNITVTASNGCATTVSRTLTSATPIVATATPTAVFCNGAASGSISTTVSGGAPGYTYLWADGPTTANRSGLLAGTYNLTVTDTRGCTGATSATVTQPSAITATPTVQAVSCFGQSNGSISLAVSGGTSPYTYLWNDGATTQNRSGLSAGTYTVTVTDNKGCKLTVNNIAVSQPAAALSLSTSVVNITCNGSNNGSATVTPTGGTAPYSYDWSGTPTGDGTATITGLAAGSYTVTVTDAKGCSAVAGVTITQPSPLTISTTFIRPTCPAGATPFSGPGYDGSISLTIAGGSTPYAIAWTAPVATPLGLIQPAQVNSANLTLLRAGTYSVTVTDAHNCTKTTSVTLTNINPNPVSPPTIKF